MSDSGAQTSQQQFSAPRGWEALKNHVIDHKVDVALWATRLCTVFFSLSYILPIFVHPYSAYYKALMSNAATSALRLHQRIPRVTLSREFLALLLAEDSCHYLFFSLIFLYVSPVTILSLFSNSQTLGQNSWWAARLLISMVEFQSRNILRLVAFTEIFLMPMSVVLVFLGRCGLLTPFIYYQFLGLRYTSRRNPYTRNMFYELRLLLERTANKPGLPSFLRTVLMSIVTFTSGLAPPMGEAGQAGR
ncbi:Krueppel homolog 2 [Gryllus bimaculatus]|nr:Krueppel homolog 2 [Gryllus bimaculatus]